MSQIPLVTMVIMIPDCQEKNIKNTVIEPQGAKMEKEWVNKMSDFNMRKHCCLSVSY